MWFFWVLAVVFAILGFVNPRSLWRTLSAPMYRNPGANEPSDLAYGIQRAVFFGGAAVMAILAMRLESLAPDDAWELKEIRAAARYAAGEVEDFSPGPTRAEDSGLDGLIDGYLRDSPAGKEHTESLTVTNVREESDAEIPEDAERVVEPYEIAADVGGDTVCLTVTRRRQDTGKSEGTNGPGSVPTDFHNWTNSAKVTDGRCPALPAP